MMRRDSGIVVDQRGAARRPRDGRFIAAAVVAIGALTYALLALAVAR